MRKTTTAVLLVLLLAVATPALAETSPEQHFALSKKLMEMGEHARAVAVLRSMMVKWPDEEEFVPAGHLLLGQALAHLGRIDDAIAVLQKAIDRYPGFGDLPEKAELMRDKLRTSRKHKRLLGEYEAAKLAEITRLWKEAGVSQEEIAIRAAMLKAQRDQIEGLRAHLEEEARRMKAAGVANEELKRRLEETQRRLEREHGAEWEARRDQEMAELRREFLHLAERMGIPGDEVEKFLEEQLKRRLEAKVEHYGHVHDRPEASDRPFHGPETNRKADELADRVQRLERALTDLVPKLQVALEKLNARMEKLERAVKER